MAALRVRAYVDGLNLLHGSLQGRPGLKWLDLVRLAEGLRPDEHVDHVRYFSAPVAGKQGPGCPRRQNLYLRAIQADPRLTYHPGRFRSHPKSMPLESHVPGGPAIVRIIKTEEKGSDVNLATTLLMDGVNGLYDVALVVSNDSELVTPVRVAAQRYGHVHVVRPNQQHNNELAMVASTYGPIPDGMIAACQLPSAVALPSGKILTRPREWT